MDAIKTIFAFGDSYTSVHYKAQQGYSPRGPEQVIRTTSGGQNWIQYLSQHLHLEDRLFDFAVSGSSIEPLVIHDGEAPNPCLINQTDVWTDYFVEKDEVTWDAESTLFVVAIGINDIANAIMLGIDYEAKMNRLVDIYTEQVKRMIDGGARHFLMLPVPPFDRTPLARTSPDHAKFVELVHTWNFRFYDLASTLQNEYAGTAEFKIWDWHTVMDEIIDNAKQVYGFEETKTSCWPYARINTYAPAAKDEECRVPMSKYVWKDSAHPTWRIHELLSKEALKFLSGRRATVSEVKKRQLAASYDRHRKRSPSGMSIVTRLNYNRSIGQPAAIKSENWRRWEPLVVEAGFSRI
ncbi:hypothetical protein OIO90_003671 [Microbotryomycetes sp. JL221]|nr:hypothetical protein OIO90_003671 [Microbotryomycetes sp. JL221]